MIYDPLIDERVLKLAGSARKTKVTYAKTWSQDALIKKITDLGYKMLGRGAYSVVFDHQDPDKVIKITLSAADGYHKYVDWILSHRDVLVKSVVKHLPRIHTTVVYKGARITVLERLREDNRLYSDTPTFDKANELVAGMAESFNLVDDSGGRNNMRRGRTKVITDPWSHNE